MTRAALQTINDESPFHPGERAVQAQAGVRAEAEKRGRQMLTADLHRRQTQFFEQVPFLLSAHTDTEGQPWASLLTGAPGFVSIAPTWGIDPDAFSSIRL